MVRSAAMQCNDTHSYDMTCFTMPYYIMQCDAMQRSAMLCKAVLCHGVPCYRERSHHDACRDRASTLGERFLLQHSWYSEVRWASTLEISLLQTILPARNAQEASRHARSKLPCNSAGTARSKARARSK